MIIRFEAVLLTRKEFMTKQLEVILCSLFVWSGILEVTFLSEEIVLW